MLRRHPNGGSRRRLRCILGLVIRIRQARVGDGAELARIERVTRTVDVSPAPAPLVGTSFFRRRTPVEEVLVAEDDGVVLGCTVRGQAISLPARGQVMDILGLAVDPGRQRSGVGPSWLRRRSRKRATRGAGKLSLRVLGPNVSARRLYERCGFVVEGVVVGESCIDGRYTDNVLMARHLRTD